MTGFAGVIFSLAALALTVEKIVSFVRHAVPLKPDGTERFPTVVWNVVALAVGVGFATGWNVNIVPSVLQMIPRFATSSALTGTSGQVLSGLAIGAASGFAYSLLQSLEATARKNNAVARHT